ncbi:MAG: xylulokinase [Lachnospiraceae bacterium]|jgi:xylulokinase
MDNTLLMSIDLGTSFIKAGVYDANSNCIASSMAEVKDERPAPGIFLQRGDDLIGSAVECMKKASNALGDRAKDVAAISFTGQMAGFMGVDKDWNDITTWSCSLDTRYMPYAERQMKTLKKEFLEISGTNSPQMAPKYEWFKSEFPEESKKIAKYVMISGYLIGKLSDIPIDEAVIDCTYTQWTGLADIAKLQWSDVICDAIGLDRKYLPRIVNSNYICGYLSEKMAKETGLKSGIALVSGAGDKAAGAFGSAVTSPGQMVFEGGSYGEITLCAHEYRPDSETGRYDCILSPVPGQYLPAKYTPGSGITLDWFMDSFYRNPGEDLGDAFKRVEQEMANIPVGCNGLMAIGLLGGSSMPLDGTTKGMFMGYDWSHGKAHFYKSLLESFTFDFQLTIDKMEELYPEYQMDKVKIIGGGAKSPTWTQMLADMSGKTYQVLDRNDLAMWAAAILSGNAIGLFGDLAETANAHVHVKKEYTPNPEMQKKYEPYKQLYKEYIEELRGFYKRIQELNG